jgi:hypothetical protein
VDIVNTEELFAAAGLETAEVKKPTAQSSNPAFLVYQLPLLRPICDFKPFLPKVNSSKEKGPKKARNPIDLIHCHAFLKRPTPSMKELPSFRLLEKNRAC